MIFTVKNVGNTDIIYIHARRPGLPEYLLIGRAIDAHAGLQNRHIVLKLNQNLVLENLFVEMALSVRRNCIQNNSSLSLCCTNPDLLSILYLLKLDRFFEFYESEHDAFSRENRLVKRRLKAV